MTANSVEQEQSIVALLMRLSKGELGLLRCVVSAASGVTSGVNEAAMKNDVTLACSPVT